MTAYGLCTKVISDGRNLLTVYGIRLPDGREIYDITFDRASAERLVAMLNEDAVEICHAPDVIEDFLFLETTIEIKRYGE